VVVCGFLLQFPLQLVPLSVVTNVKSTLHRVLKSPLRMATEDPSKLLTGLNQPLQHVPRLGGDCTRGDIGVKGLPETNEFLHDPPVVGVLANDTMKTRRVFLTILT